MARRAVSCPECGSKETLEIVYGEPDPALGEAAARGDVALGGCVLTGNDPDRRCRACGTDFVSGPRQAKRGSARRASTKKKRDANTDATPARAKRSSGADATAATGRLADAVVAGLQRNAEERGNVVPLAAARMARATQDRMEADLLELVGIDPAVAVYTTAFRLMMHVANGLVRRLELRNLRDKVARANADYGGEPTPVTQRVLLQWTLLDLSDGPAHETVGTIIEQTLDRFLPDPDLAKLVREWNRSRFGVYVQGTTRGRFFRLRELVTGATGEFVADHDYRGKPGNVLLVRTLPPPGNGFERGAVLMPPYQIRAPGEDAWLAYFDRVLPSVNRADPVAAYEQLMKRGLGSLGELYWPEYICRAFVENSETTVFLEGLPGIATKRARRRSARRRSTAPSKPRSH